MGLFDVQKLKHAIAEFEQFCNHRASEYGRKLEKKAVANYAYPGREKVKSRMVAFSQFHHDKLSGRKNLDAFEVDDVIAAYRRVAREFVGADSSNAVASEVDRLETRICRELSLDDPPIRARHFAQSEYIRDSRTPSLACHHPEVMRAYAREIIESYRQGDMTWSSLLGQLTKVIEVSSRPSVEVLSAFDVLHDSIVFDESNWCQVPTADDLRRRPVQPTYCTRIVRLGPRTNGAKSVLLEFNTGGFGVYPVAGHKASPWRNVFAQGETAMSESIVSNRTLYVEYDLPKDRDSEHEIVFHGVFFNGTQDQVHRVGANGRNCEFDWYGKRVSPTTLNADLAILLPVNRRCDAWKFVRRSEAEGRDRVQQANAKERVFEPATMRSGTLVEGAKVIWKIPRVHEVTIFSFHWSWEQTFPKDSHDRRK